MRLGIAFFSCAAVLAGSAQAHHSFAMFDNQKDVTIEGTVKSFQWTNPHTWIQLMVKDANGTEAEWSLEGQSPNGLVRQGWQKPAPSMFSARGWREIFIASSLPLTCCQPI